MSLLQKIFGKKSPLDPLRRSFRQGRWSDAIVLSQTLSHQDLDEEERAELEALLIDSGDRLAELNLEEGEACLRAGDREKASEHFSMALGQARSDEPAQRAEEGLKKARENPGEANPWERNAGESSCSNSCSAALAGSPEGFVIPDDLDPSIRMEFILASYPPDLQHRYRESGPLFQNALQFIHNGDDEAAAGLLAEIPESDRDDLYHFERGALFGRMGNPEAGIAEMERSLEINPDLWLALESLVRMELGSSREESAEQRLLSALSRGGPKEFCFGHLALVCARRGNLEKALEHGLAAIEEGARDPDVLSLISALLEKTGRLDEAETLLGYLPAGSAGCSGGINLNMAEFWLRHKKNLDQSLEAFKGAARNDTENPRWRLRIAQVYLAKGWKREGLSFLENILSDPHLNPELRREGEALQSMSNP